MKQHITKKECPDCSVGSEEYCARLHPEDEVKGMKQHITTKQLNELSEKEREKLRKWWKPKDGNFYSVMEKDKFMGGDVLYGLSDVDWLKENNSLPLLSIGQMIEFLVEKQDKGWRDLHIEMLHDRWGVGTCYDNDIPKWKFKNDKGELCDALWEAVKEVLNE